MSLEKIPVPGYGGRYLVDRLGSVYSVKTEKEMFQSTHRDGYKQVNLYLDGRRSTHKVHRIVVAAFLGAIGEGLEVNHKNGDRADNRLENLETLTKSENTLHSYRVLNRASPPARDSKPVLGKYPNGAGFWFPSKKDAARFIGGYARNITSVCLGSRKTYKGFSWCEV